MKVKKQDNLSPYDLEEKINFVVSVYHFEMRKDIKRILANFEEAIIQNNDSCLHLQKAKQLFVSFTDKLNLHVLFEENIIFPVLNTEHGRGQYMHLSLFLRKLESEHTEDKLLLKEILDVLSLSQSSKARYLQGMLKEFKLKLDEHSKYEEDCIFKSYYEIIGME